MNSPLTSSRAPSARPTRTLASTIVHPNISVRREATPPGETGQLLARLVADESALYGIMRDWRYHSAGRKFVRLHALIDRQFTETGRRLAKLAACSRGLELHVSAGPGGSHFSRPAPDERALEEHMIRELLELHETLLARLREGKSMTVDHGRDRSTIGLLAHLITEHEKDAVSLRGLLGEGRKAEDKAALPGAGRSAHART